MLRFRSNPSFFLLIFSLFFLFVVYTSGTALPNHTQRFLGDGVEIAGRSQYFDVLQWMKRKLMADAATANSSLVLAQDRTRRKDPLDHFNRYTSGWNISNKHYNIASV